MKGKPALVSSATSGLTVVPAGARLHRNGETEPGLSYLPGSRPVLSRSLDGAIQSDAQYAVDSTNRWRLSRWRRRNSATRSFWHFSRSTLIFEIDSRR